MKSSRRVQVPACVEMSAIVSQRGTYGARHECVASKDEDSKSNMGDAITPLIAGPSPEQYFASPLFVRSRLHLACALRTTHLAMEPAPSTEATPVVELASSSGGRVSGKAWKPQKKATVYVFCASPSLCSQADGGTPSRSHIQEGVRTKNWEDRMEKEKKAQAIKKLQAELKEEQEAERKAYVPRLPTVIPSLTPP